MTYSKAVGIIVSSLPLTMQNGCAAYLFARILVVETGKLLVPAVLLSIKRYDWTAAPQIYCLPITHAERQLP
jgi:hypothetical protein